MIQLKLITDDMEIYDRKNKIVEYSEKAFLWKLGGVPGQEHSMPFRDESSLKFIREIDHGELVEGDWYSYVSPHGRTCMSGLCGGTQYALTCIDNSRAEVYTLYEGYGRDIWGRLEELDEKILIAFNPCKDSYGVPAIPHNIEYCVVENCMFEGAEQECIADRGSRLHDPQMVDGRLCMSIFLGKEYRWNWTEHLKEIFEAFKSELPRGSFIFDIAPTEVTDLKCLTTEREVEIVDDDYKTIQTPKGLGRERIFNHMAECLTDSYDKYPRELYVRRFSDGHYEVDERCPCKYPTFLECLQDTVEFWNDEYEEAWNVVIDMGCFYELSHFKCDKIWYHRDNGKVLDLYSGALGMKKFLEFIGDAVETGKLIGIERELSVTEVRKDGD
ncbi:MAG: hypothetical protein HFG34_03120 [Eubacterium sp.]|nr:hypothetical protein [Eubacterium sp.]